MHIIFDLDGTLFDTRDLVTEAYATAGVKMPYEAWMHPWRKWLPALIGDEEEAARIHDIKNKVYIDAIESGRATQLPCLQILKDLNNSRLASVGILTGASREAASALMHIGQIASVTLIGAGMSRLGKTDALHGVAPHGIYVDDIPFDVPGWRVVGYNEGETRGQVLDKLWMQ